MHRHLHRRRDPAVRRQQIGQAPADGACRADIERADQAGANRADLVFRQFDLLLGAGAREQRFSGLRQLDPATGSIEKLRPQRGFECLDLLAQRGLGTSRRAATVKLHSSATAMKYRAAGDP